MPEIFQNMVFGVTGISLSGFSDRLRKGRRS
jgi:hypothetical protein